MWSSDVSYNRNEMTRHDAVICLQNTAMVAVGGGWGEQFLSCPSGGYLNVSIFYH